MPRSPAGPGATRRAAGRAALVAAGVLAFAAPAAAQVRQAPPEPLRGFGIAASPGLLARGVSPADTVPLFAPHLSTVSLLPRYQTTIPGERPQAPENLALDAWLARERDREAADAWERAKVERLQGILPEGEAPPGDLDTALRLPREVESLFGGASTLDVNGRLRVAFGGGRTTLEPDLRPPGFPRSDLNLDLDQILELDVRGTIGRRVNVAVDFNSEREFQNKNLLSAVYAGDEDEILKRVELGDISVSLPPSRFLNVGATKGNFGVQGVGQLGPVSFRGIAGRKEGETTERRLTITPRAEGVIETVTLELKDTQYQNSRFFLLFHPDSLAGGRIAFPNQGTQLADPASRPEGPTLNVWRDNGNPTDDLATNAKFGTAFVNPTLPDALPADAQQGFFNLLIEGQDYVVVDDAILTMDRQLNANEILAVSYVTQGGTPVGSPQDADTLDLKLVKPVNPDSLDFTWDYTLRNVYPLRGNEVLLQDVSVYRGDRQLRTDFEQVQGQSLKYSQILGIADLSERPLQQVVGRDPFGGPDFLVFPDLRPFFQPVPFPPDTVDLEVPNRALYRIAPEQRVSATQDQIYFLTATYRGRAGQTNEIELGSLNILEGSETVTIGGVELQRGTDYQIFYDFGRLVFSEPEALFARFPNAQVDISFEVAPLFNLAPTTVGGFNAVYRAGERLFLNSTLFLQSTESLSNRPILGAEPTRSFLAEMDGNWETELPFLTGALDGLPLLRAQGPSTLRVRGEAAMNLPNPNTEGRVFLNDFEGVELATSVSLNQRTYLFGSVPQGTGFSALDARDLEVATRAAPLDQVTTEQIVGNRAVVEVMRVDVRDPVFPGVVPESSWRSLTHRISVQGTDVSRQETLEFFVRGDVGTILVDLGTVDEDGVRFNRGGTPVGLGQLDTEDENRDNQLDAQEDTGLDGVSGADQLLVEGDDGNDDFQPGSNPLGTEGSDVLDTEDLNLNGVLDRREDLLRWEVDLQSSEFVAPGSQNENGFRQIRLPLQRPTVTLGSPNLRQVQAIRFTFTDFGPDVGGTDVELAQLEIVGSTFLERGVVGAGGEPLAGARSDTLGISQVNTLESPDYFSPPGVTVEQERADEIIRTGLQPLKEQSLVLEYRDLPAGASGRIYQPLPDRESYLDYDRMQVFVNGQFQSGVGGQPISPDRMPLFFVEFGADTLNVYRFQERLSFNDWDEHVIEFAVFTGLKAELLRQLAESGERTGSLTSDDGRYEVLLVDDRAPTPTLSQVTQLTIGVENDVGEEIQDGSFWVDDWRLTGPVTEGGGARYLSASARLADVGTVDVQFESRDARFRNLAATVSNQSSSDVDVRTTFQLDRLLPAALGLDMPLTVDHFTTNDRPLFLVGSDLEVDEDDFLRRRQTIRNTQTAATLSLRRTRRSSNGLVRATFDNLSARLTLRDQDFESLDLDRRQDAWDLTLRYDTDFARRPIGLPFEVLEGLPLPGFVKESKAFRSLVNLDLNLLPSRLSLVGTSLDGDQSLLKRQGFFGVFDDESVDTNLTADTTRTATGDLNVVFQPTNSLRANYSLSSTRDLNFPDADTVDLGETPLPGIEALRTQRVDVQWTPPVTDWLVPRYNYSATYGLNHTREVSRILQGQDLRDFTGQVTRGWTVEFNLPVLLDRALGAEPRPGAPGVPAEGDRQGFDLRDLLQPVRLETSKRRTSAFRQVPDSPSLRYTFGFQDPIDLPAEAQNIAEIERFGVTSGISPIPSVQIQGGYQWNDQDRLFFGGSNNEVQEIWPDVAFRWSLRSFPAPFSALLRQLDVTSDFQKETGHTDAKGARLSEYDRDRWGPLVALDATWGNGLVTILRAQKSDNDVTTVRGGTRDALRSESADEVELTLNYLIRPGTRVFLPVPFLMGDRIKGPLRTSLTLARRLREDVTFAFGADPEAPPQEGLFNVRTRTLEVRPGLSYDLPRVSSGIAFSYLLRDDEKRDVETTTYSVELFVDLTF